MNIDRNLILCLFGGYTAKLLALGAQPADAAVVLVLAGAHFLYNSQIQNKEINKLKQELVDMKKAEYDQNMQISDMKTAVTGMKINNSLRNIK